MALFPIRMGTMILSGRLGTGLEWAPCGLIFEGYIVQDRLSDMSPHPIAIKPCKAA